MPEKLLCRCGYTSISKWAFYIVFSDCYTHSKSEDNNVIFDNESWGMSMNQNLYPHLFQPLTEVTESDIIQNPLLNEEPVAYEFSE